MNHDEEISFSLYFCYSFFHLENNPNIKELIQENNNTIQNNNTTIIPAFMDKQRPNLPKYLCFIFFLFFTSQIYQNDTALPLIMEKMLVFII